METPNHLTAPLSHVDNIGTASAAAAAAHTDTDKHESPSGPDPINAPIFASSLTVKYQHCHGQLLAAQKAQLPAT